MTNYMQTAQRTLAARRGFTLIELVITVAIIGILAAIALPSYTTFIVKGNRSAAQSAMLDIANREQQYILANRVYATKANLEANGYGLDAKIARLYDYTVTVGNGNVPTYLITFTPTTTGAQKNDVTLTLDQAGTKTPADKW
jgi:type IV pilus assembly protein PilE